MRPWVVVPVFDEVATVGRVVTAARAVAPVLVVDDGSTDGSGAAAEAAGAVVVRHPRRLGKGQALRTGIAAARARGATVVVTLDGDGQHDPRDLPALLAAAQQSPRAIVVGGRVGDGRSDRVPPGRLNAIRVAGFFVGWVTGLSLRDTQSGFRVYPVALFDEVRLRHGGFVFETEVLVTAASRGWEVREVPIHVVPRAGRRSRFRPLADGVAIGGYLAWRTLVRWGVEAREAGREVAAVFGRERRRVRHAEILAAGMACTGSPAAWGTAVAGLAAGRASSRIAGWWQHPRRRRASAAAWATLAAPGVLALAVAQALGGRLLPDVLTPVVERVYSLERLDAASRGGAP